MQELNTMEDFRRDISYRLLKQQDGTAVLTALLTDRFHDITVDVVVDAATLTIVSASAEFRKAPTADCGNVPALMPRLAGFTIGRGLRQKLVEVFGGGQGCGNMRNLLSGLLPLALNLRAAAGISDEREMLDTIHEHLRGSCAGYENPVPSQNRDTD
jgi:hypothetical protein